jgi:integrase
MPTLAPIEDLFSARKTLLPPLIALFDEYVTYRQTLTANPKPGRARASLSDTSANVYRSMWLAFAEDLVAHDVPLEDISIAYLEAFLDRRAHAASKVRLRRPKTSTLNDRYARRILTLVDRLLVFHAFRANLPPNRAAADLIKRDFKEVNARDRDPRPVWFTASERKRLYDCLGLRAGSGYIGAPQTWQDVRDNAIVAVQLGSGLAPGEVRTLRLQDYVARDDGHLLCAPGNGIVYARDTPIEAWAVPVLATWLQERARQRIPGELLFCLDDGSPLHKNSVDQACDRVLQRASVTVRGGHFRLRHSYVFAQLAATNQNFSLVARYLGVKDVENWYAKYRPLIDSFATGA